MSVPADRMAPRPMGNPDKIMGMPKWAFYVVIVLGLILAYYIYKRSTAASSASLQTADAGTEPTTNGLTAADIGGTPSDNSFATQTDEDALESQIQSLQSSYAQLAASNGGGGAGLQPGSPGGSVVNGPIQWPTNPNTSWPTPLTNFPTNPGAIDTVVSNFGGQSPPPTVYAPFGANMIPPYVPRGGAFVAT